MRFAGVLGFDKILQVRQAGAPEGAVLLNPVVDSPEGFRIEFVDAVAALAMFSNEMGAAEKAQVFGDGRAGDREGSGDLSGWLATATEKVENGSAGGVGKGVEGGFLRLRDGIC